MSSNKDYDGPEYRPVSGRGADEQGGAARSAGGQGAGQGGPQYPAPEGWENGGFWRDSSIDSDYETSMHRPVPPAPAPSQRDPGNSYWSASAGWQNTPRAGSGPYPGQVPDATRVGYGADATRVGYGAGGPGVPGGAPNDATSVYGGGPGGTGSYGRPAGPGTGGYGPGGYGAPGVSPGRPAGPNGPGGPGAPGGPGGPRRPPLAPSGKRKGSWWRRWTWKKFLAVSGSLVVLFILALFGVYQYLSSTATIPTALASASYQRTTVYYADGKDVLGTIGTTNRQDLTFAQIPTQLQDAVVAAEDKNFWTEGGISPTGILRAAIHDVTSGGGSLNGGSTITQEFVRGYYGGVGTQQTTSRKIKEIFIAQKLAQTKSKQWIMTNYLNLIYLGDNSYGVSAAAETYFGVPVSKLTVAQDAVIAGIIQQPSTYPLPSYRTSLKARWTYVLEQMVTDKYITQAQMSTMKFPVMLTDKTGSASGGASIKANNSDPWAPYIMTQVQAELKNDDHVSDQQIETGGLKIVTTISPTKEKQLYAAVSANLNSESIRNTAEATVTSLPPWALVGAELQDPKTGEIIAEYPGKGQSTGCTNACMLNTAWQSRNQVGSSFKPYVLATALKAGMNVASSKLNTSPFMCIAPDESSQFSVPLTQPVYEADTASKGCLLPGGAPVENDEGELIGKQVGQAPSGANAGATYFSDNVQDALAASSNTGFTDLAHRAGTANIIKMAEDVGVDGSKSGANFAQYQGGVGLALGIASISVQEQATMLSTMADNGQYHQAHLVKYWSTAGGGKQLPKPEQHMVLTPQQAQDEQYAMEMTNMGPNGTAAATVSYGQQALGTVISKTGTTTDSKSGFFIGATSQYSLVVGMFTVSPAASENLAELGGGGFGGYWPAKIWNSFAETAFSSSPQTFPTTPSGEGTPWDMLGTVPKAKPTKTCVVNGKKVKVKGKACPTPTPPGQQCQYNPQDGQRDLCPGGGQPTPTCSYDGQQNCTPTDGTGGNPTPTPTCQFQGQQNCTPTDGGGGGTNPTPTPTCDFPGDPSCTTSTGGGNGGGGQTGGFGTQSGGPTATGAVGGAALAAPPGLLLWASSRRRRKRRGEAAE